MKLATLALVAVAAVVAVPVASAADPVVPFPAPKGAAVFVSAETLTTNGAVSNFFAPGSTVVFRAYAVDTKTKQLVNAKTARYFYVKIPGRSNLKMKWTPGQNGAGGRYGWTVKWTVPTDYPDGLVPFKVLVQTKAKRLGMFVQVPVSTATLTVTKTPQTPPAPGPAATAAPGSSKVTMGIYVDSVNGTRPAGAKPRPIGCTQTNVFQRGEQFVLRAWGIDLLTNEVLAMENVSNAHFTVPGTPDIQLNWGSHGAVGSKVWFWTNQWQIPKDYPLGDIVVKVSFTTTAGKTETFDYPITIIP